MVKRCLDALNVKLSYKTRKSNMDDTLVFNEGFDPTQAQDGTIHFLIPDDPDMNVTCENKWYSASGHVAMVTCEHCLKLIAEGAPTQKAEPYKFGERDLFVGCIEDPTKEWPESVDWEHDGTYDLEEGLDLITDEYIRDEQYCIATIMSLRENCKRLLARVKELEDTNEN